jgi:hypothetical protein
VPGKDGNVPEPNREFVEEMLEDNKAEASQDGHKIVTEDKLDDEIVTIDTKFTNMFNKLAAELGYP